MSPETIWTVSIGLFLLVGVVVVVLLEGIRRTAGQIHDGVNKIWTHGQLVANNTIQIPIFLTTTRRVVATIFRRIGPIGQAAQAIEEHAEGCPGCPACVMEGGKKL